MHAGTSVTVDTTFTYSTCYETRVTASVWNGAGGAVPLVPDAMGFVPNTRFPAGRGTARLVVTFTVPPAPRVLRFEGRYSYIGFGRGETFPMFSVEYPVVD